MLILAITIAVMTSETEPNLTLGQNGVEVIDCGKYGI